jgi:hypothetical protein
LTSAGFGWLVAPTKTAATAAAVTGIEASALRRALSLRRAAGCVLSGWAVAALAAAIAAAVTSAVTATTSTPLTAAIAATTTTAMACVAARAFAFTHALQHLGAGVAGSSLHHIAAWRLASATPNGLATHGNGFGFFTWLRHEAFNDLHRNILLGEALNVLHEAFLIQTH